MALWLSRLLVGLVLAWNVQSALAFMIFPASFSPGFELKGSTAEAFICGIGVLFLMWNVPYGVAFWHPVRHRLSLIEAMAMQAIGLAGESWIFIKLLDTGHIIARQSLARFLVFDAIGLVALLAAAWISRKS